MSQSHDYDGNEDLFLNEHVERKGKKRGRQDKSSKARDKRKAARQAKEDRLYG